MIVRWRGRERRLGRWSSLAVAMAPLGLSILVTAVAAVVAPVWGDWLIVLTIPGLFATVVLGSRRRP